MIVGTVLWIIILVHICLENNILNITYYINNLGSIILWINLSSAESNLPEMLLNHGSFTNIQIRNCTILMPQVYSHKLHSNHSLWWYSCVLKLICFSKTPLYTIRCCSQLVPDFWKLIYVNQSIMIEMIQIQKLIGCITVFIAIPKLLEGLVTQYLSCA